MLASPDGIRRIHVDPWPPARLGWGARARLALGGLLLSPLYWLASHPQGTPGLSFNLHSAQLGLRALMSGRRRLPLNAVFRMLFGPIDSVRYFEFQTIWNWLRAAYVTRYLDVSSPRLFPVLALAKHRQLSGALMNPDMRDLLVTSHLAQAIGVSSRCVTVSCLVEDAPFPSAEFDAITSISVLEHIPDESSAVRSMWRLLRPGGKLLLTVPCARQRSEEFIDQDVYRLHGANREGMWFWQRFYDADLLQERLFSVLGVPRSIRVYGEKRPGRLYENALRKWTDQAYPFWREPYMMGREFDFYDSIADLPGQGVVALEFIRP